MELTNVSCNKCGASLQISASANFVTCRYCGAQLEIKRTDSTISTEVLSRIDRNTASMAEDLSAIRRETEVERLDREWALRRESLMISGKNGKSEPSIVGGIFAMVVCGVFGLFFAITAAANGAPVIFPIFGVFFMIMGVGIGISSFSKASAYSDEEKIYRRNRDDLLKKQSAPAEEPVNLNS